MNQAPFWRVAKWIPYAVWPCLGVWIAVLKFSGKLDTGTLTDIVLVGIFLVPALSITVKFAAKRFGK